MSRNSTTDVCTDGSINPISSPYSDVETKKNQDVAVATPFWKSCRLWVMVCCFFSFLANFSGQTIMTSAMVCMIESSSRTNDFNNITTNETSRIPENDWKFTWDSKTQNLILSSYFILYYVGQLPSGIMAQRKFLIISHAIAGLLQIATVPATQWSLPGIIVIRSLGGLGSSALYTNTVAILANWTPRQETSVVFGSVGIGMEAGPLLSFGLSIIACQIDLLGGWPFILFWQGASHLIVMVLFLLTIHENPTSHPSMTPGEKSYLLSSTIQKKTWKDTPVRVILTSLPVYAFMVCKLSGLCAYFVYVVTVPQYVRDVLKIPKIYISLVFSLPFLLIFPSVIIMGKMADYVVLHGLASNTTVRKFFDFCNKILFAALIIILGYLPENSWPMVFGMSLAIIFILGTGYLTYEANAADLSPAHNGFINAFVQTTSYWITFASSLVIGAITEETTRENWQKVFYIVAGIQVAAFVFYALFGSGELQPWARHEEGTDSCPHSNKELDVIRNHSTPIEKNNGLCYSFGEPDCKYTSSITNGGHVSSVARGLECFPKGTDSSPSESDIFTGSLVNPAVVG